MRLVVLVQYNLYFPPVIPCRYELRAPFSTASFVSADNCPSNFSTKATSQELPAEKMSIGRTASCTVTTCRLSPIVRSRVSVL